MIRLFAQIVTLLGILTASIAIIRIPLPKEDVPLSQKAVTPNAERRQTPTQFYSAPVPSLSEFPQTTARPLFFEGRRLPTKPQKQVAAETPKEPPKQATPPPPPRIVPLPERTELLGVVVHLAERKALVTMAGQPASWLKIGDRIGSWTISAIESGRAMLTQGNNSMLLSIYSKK